MFYETYYFFPSLDMCLLIHGGDRPLKIVVLNQPFKRAVEVRRMEMQSVTSINHQVIMDQERRSALNEPMGRRVINRLFGCWIHELGRPFSHNGRTYRVCVKCGMSRDFDPASWKTHGHYHATEPNFSYPKISACRPVRTNGKPSSYTRPYAA
jgi:hypothetical protein